MLSSVRLWTDVHRHLRSIVSNDSMISFGILPLDLCTTRSPIMRASSRFGPWKTRRGPAPSAHSLRTPPMAFRGHEYLKHQGRYMSNLSRRSFLRTGLAGGATLAVSTVSTAAQTRQGALYPGHLFGQGSRHRRHRRYDDL